MDIMDEIIAKARSVKPHIVLAEGEDQRVANAAQTAVEQGIAKISVIANPEKLKSVAGVKTANQDIEIINPKTSPLLKEYANSYFELRKNKGITEEGAHSAILQNINFAAMMVRTGHADGTIAGAVTTSSDTIRAALQIIGKAPDSNIVSSYFLMILPPPHNRPVIFADCGLVALPSSPELADIAISSANSFEKFTGEMPKVALLSFSTKGSASHESITRVQKALEIAKSKAPTLAIEGEIQFDAAIDLKIQQHKAPDSKLNGEANVFIFPDLNAGNIGYKIAERIGGAVALGPILQGLAKPANDLSRGCSTDDVYQMIAITAAQAADSSDSQSKSDPS